MTRFSFFLLSFVFSAFAVHAQIDSKKPAKECNALLARQVVEQQADESKSVEETGKRIRILILAADFLWIADETAARKYFAEAFQIAQERFKEKGFEEERNKDGLLVRQPDYRFGVIGAIAEHDAEWAKKLSEIVLKEFDEDKEKDKRRDFDKEHEVSEIIGIAADVAKDNPNLALTLARRAMRYPLTNAWYFSLYEMAKNNQPLTDQIYGELLLNYADTEIFRLLYLSAYPFGRDRIFGVEKYSLGTSIPAGFSPNQNLQRQFLLTLFRRINRLTPENTIKSLEIKLPESVVAFTAMNEIEPLVMQQFPDLARTFSQAKIYLSSITPADALQDARKQEDFGKSYDTPFDEKLAEVEKADEEGKLDDYQIFEIIRTAKTEENYKQAETWIDKIKEDSTRESASNYFYFQRSKLATKEKRFEDARKYALKVPKIEHRAVLFFDIAEAKLKEPMTKLDALETLLEVYQTAQKAPDTIEKAQVFLGTAFMYEKIDHYNALGALSDAIKTANKLENPNLFTSSVTQIIKGKDFTFFSSYAVPGFNITETFYELSKQDFLNALTNATNFSDKYLRTLAALATVKDCEKNDKLLKAKPKTKSN
ncbi:MAG: hypothetical protein ACR2HG_12800 [Pyrinomonadaceae bacterium]